MRRVLLIAGIVVGSLALVAGAGTGLYAWANLSYFDRGMSPVWSAGYVERQATIDGSTLNYAEGPANGPALLLIPGQGVDWQNYFPVLPSLAQRYHVFAVDVYGHGRSARVPSKYSVPAIGKDLATFLRTVVGGPAIVSGHSSGGQLATWLAAYEPTLVRGAVLEDPPLLTTLFPRARQTWNYVDLATTCHEFLASGQTDWIAFSLPRSRMWRFFGDAGPPLIADGLRQHAANPDQPVRYWMMPATFNELYRGGQTYDPRFGDAFYTGSWDAGWDHLAAMRAITVPTVYIHTAVPASPDGILQAATSDEEAATIRATIPGVEFHQTTSGHGFHFEQPENYLTIVDGFAARLPQ